MAKSYKQSRSEDVPKNDRFFRRKANKVHRHKVKELLKETTEENVAVLERLTDGWMIDQDDIDYADELD